MGSIMAAIILAEALPRTAGIVGPTCPVSFQTPSRQNDDFAQGPLPLSCFNRPVHLPLVRATPTHSSRVSSYRVSSPVRPPRGLPKVRPFFIQCIVLLLQVTEVAPLPPFAPNHLPAKPGFTVLFIQRSSSVDQRQPWRP